MKNEAELIAARHARKALVGKCDPVSERKLHKARQLCHKYHQKRDTLMEVERKREWEKLLSDQNVLDGCTCIKF